MIKYVKASDEIITVLWGDEKYTYDSRDKAESDWADMEGNFTADGMDNTAELANWVYGEILDGETEIEVSQDELDEAFELDGE